MPRGGDSISSSCRSRRPVLAPADVTGCDGHPTHLLVCPPATVLHHVGALFCICPSWSRCSTRGRARRRDGQRRRHHSPMWSPTGGYLLRLDRTARRHRSEPQRRALDAVAPHGGPARRASGSPPTPSPGLQLYRTVGHSGPCLRAPAMIRATRPVTAATERGEPEPVGPRKGGLRRHRPERHVPLYRFRPRRDRTAHDRHTRIAPCFARRAHVASTRPARLT